MAKSELYLEFNAKVGKKTIAIPAVKIADGVISTSELINNTLSSANPALGDDAFQRIIKEAHNANIMFLIQQANIRSSELKTAKEFNKEVANVNDAENNAELKRLNKEYKKNKNFAMLGISLDIDREAWEPAIKKDTLSWDQVCDFTGLSSETAKQYAILTLPTNILLSPTGKILARDIQGEALTDKLKELLKTEEKKPGKSIR